MTVQAKTPDITDVADIGPGPGAPAVPPGARPAVSPAALTCAWVRAGDGALVMRWTGQEPADTHEQMTRDAA